ncbi:hypothetical protein [uncultured Pseudacidovorax sp.]|uniref:hypothetical protein n=1 Tax=uncultured Pseudacidovorax sp. TaxID=679313 RepID=UPI0025FBA089|nr:hypothetical protein [uncultured Pseudacidovorax sp.]
MTAVIVITSDLKIRRARQDLDLGLDAKRLTAWSQYGYKQDLTFADFKRAYDRRGAGLIQLVYGFLVLLEVEAVSESR